jgi:hypothetical protein
MIVKKTKQLGNFKKGINLYVPTRIRVSAAPSGLPVASTTKIAISGLGGANGSYARMGTGTNPIEDWILTGYAYRDPSFNNGFNSRRFLFAPNSTISDVNPSNQLGTPYSSWTLVTMYHDSEYNSWITESISINPSTDATTIPTTGWSPSLTITEDLFPSSISFEGDFGPLNSAPTTIIPATYPDEYNIYNTEIPALADQNYPLRIYTSFTPNGYGGVDYIYMIYLANSTAGYYPQSISAGRWLIGNGYSYEGDNSGFYINFGYYTALQSKLTVPSSNIANWTRAAGSYPNQGSITSITFNA